MAREDDDGAEEGEQVAHTGARGEH
jgi:hypothetical protein